MSDGRDTEHIVEALSPLDFMLDTMREMQKSLERLVELAEKRERERNWILPIVVEDKDDHVMSVTDHQKRS